MTLAQTRVNLIFQKSELQLAAAAQSTYTSFRARRQLGLASQCRMAITARGRIGLALLCTV